MPTPAQSHVNAPLTNLSLAVIQGEEGFISDKVFPLLPVEKQSDIYYVYNRGDMLRDEAGLRAPGTESAGGTYRLDPSNTYSCAVYAYHEDISDQERANADSMIKVDSDHTAAVTRKLLIKREKNWMDAYFKTGVWAKEYEGGAWGGGKDFVQWSDYTAGHSDPLVTVDTAMLYMATQTGFRPNVLVVSPDVFAALKAHPVILDRIKYTQRGIVTEDLLASLFGVERFLVPWSIYNSSAIPDSPSYGFIGGTKSVLLAYAAKGPGLRVASAGYTFSWKGLEGSNAGGTRILKFRMEWLQSDRVEGEHAFAQKIVSTDLGIWLKAVIA